MTTITPREALKGHEWAIVTRERPRMVYDLYPERDIANRICNDLNSRYGDKYQVAAIDYGEYGTTV